MHSFHVRKAAAKKKKRRKKTSSKPEPPKRPPATVFDRQQKIKAQCKKHREMECEKRDKSLKGKLVDDTHSSNLSARKVRDRSTGDCAASIKQVKDNGSRRAMHAFVKGSVTASRMMSHGDEAANRICPRPAVAGILVDRVMPNSNTVNFDHKCSRESPLRLAFGCNREDLLWLADDIKGNIDSWKFGDDPFTVDEDAFGHGRVSLEKVLKKSFPKHSVQENKENKAHLNAEATAITKTPQKASALNVKEVLVDW